jgi:radical SAM protein with 4Fe4S-binding SPASM domain
LVRRLTDRARLITSYLRGSADGPRGPSALMLETTVRCNLLCPMCPRTGAGYPNEDMPDDMLWRVLAEHAELGGDHVYLYGLGEPLMDVRVFDVLKRCEELGLDTILSTNATLLTAERRRRLLAEKCDHLLVGIDGASEETYGYYRKGGKYARVSENLRALGKEKLAAGSKMAIVVQFIRMKRNAHEVDEFVRQWRGVPGIDLVRIKSEDIGLDEHRTYAVDGDQRVNPCHLLWRGPMIIRWDGRVYACYHHAEHGEPVGNLAESSFGEIWRSEGMRRLRTLHSEGRPAEDSCCATCPAARPRLPFVLGAMALSGTAVRRMVPVAERVALKFPQLFSEPRDSLID